MQYGELIRIESRDHYTEIGMRSGAFGYVIGLTARNSYLVSSWETCREEFPDKSIPIHTFMFCHHSDKSYAVACFIDKVESKVKAKPRTVIGPTQYRKVSYVRLSGWWRKDKMRLSLLTLLLRAGQSYDPEVGNFEQALCAMRYTRQTLPAIWRFLKGYTQYTGKSDGWNDQFFHNGCAKKKRVALPPDEWEINRLLVRPS